MATAGHYRNYSRKQRMQSMEMPLFPLGVVLFPGMVLPLTIFEPRYLEMVERCIDEKIPFGVVLLREGKEVGETAVPHDVGTAARITRVERQSDGRINVVAIGTRRFRIRELKRQRVYLVGEVSHFPVLNGDTKSAADFAHKVRPRILQYVDLLTRATGIQLKVDQLPEDPTTLAFVTAIALQVSSKDKQRILSLPGIPDILNLENYLLGRELQLLQHMLNTQHIVESLSTGPTGYIFPN